MIYSSCYERKSLELDKRITLILSSTRELDRDPFYKVVYLIYYYQWSVLTTVHPTLIDHVLSMLYDITCSRIFY